MVTPSHWAGLNPSPQEPKGVAFNHYLNPKDCFVRPLMSSGQPTKRSLLVRLDTANLTKKKKVSFNYMIKYLY